MQGYQFSPRQADAEVSVFRSMNNGTDYGVLNDIASELLDPREIILQ
ncbi:hypothetical protein ID80_004928 [Salmonella enterica subsp. enterica serovar Ball]|nr:hypothetical protein [Salmonella enterica subsp. enterica serovar Ball]